MTSFWDVTLGAYFFVLGLAIKEYYDQRRIGKKVDALIKALKKDVLQSEINELRSQLEECEEKLSHN